MKGELRDFPNAVSVYDVDTGAQDSLEYYPVPEVEQAKYASQGSADYYQQFIRKSFIDQRYKGTFKQVKIINETYESENQLDLLPRPV